jgi:acyl-CoA reductase-like NAD-dependent aldehyde dehydrogenase
MPPPATAPGLMLRDVLLTAEEYLAMKDGLADSDAPATGERSLTEWNAAHGAELGRTHANELNRHYRQLTPVLGSGGEASWLLDYYADLGADYPWEEPAPTVGALGGPSLSLAQFGLIVREPVGVVAAIVAWPGVLNVVTADREVSELLVRDPRVDKIALTGSTAAGRRIASIMAERIGRYTLELGGKSAALILDDADLEAAAAKLAAGSTFDPESELRHLAEVVELEERGRNPPPPALAGS